ncbi:UDP-N-acetylglucosamine 2-epimerase (non-hydrolyzing) [Cyclobacterium sp.]|uniref:non-hydrolyzing UDP-N-acetylglucosamine 2-epimerase n=1 Tax=Cyclobacterium sp. TaxID=1966343 RepID=UPI0019837443|nr:UDP-N-acetylglucosamine 2-epimerase (non-hydrolyzing) [Cyclobacterium sp.]MBD3626969.1 UDP-N-acetylglucosamine 2-epimerase (non-hydrolyzing) [Cyclobacterium sp.]
MVHVDLIAGARPNFMKISPIIDAIKAASGDGKAITFRLIHTGQHYDKNMSGSFFEQLGIPEPDVNLGAGGGTQAEQTAAIMIGYEKLLMESGKPDLCLVVGDVTSTMACAITAQKLHVKVAHVEAGIRSGDWSMPEEINRMVTDSITNYFFTTSEVANQNLRDAGIGGERIFYVGNTMIDTLLKHRPRFQQPEVWSELGLEDGKYLVMTLHRPANVDQEEKLKDLIQKIVDHTLDLPLVFPVHPRTKKMLQNIGISHERLHMIDPLGYLEFNYLVEKAKAVVTDSGGITEETTVMGIPCMTLRDNTERPETITQGTNELLGTDPKAIPPAMEKLFSGNWKTGKVPHLWDGQTAKRIVEILLEKL